MRGTNCNVYKQIIFTAHLKEKNFQVKLILNNLKTISDLKTTFFVPTTCQSTAQLHILE